MDGSGQAIRRYDSRNSKLHVRFIDKDEEDSLDVDEDALITAVQAAQATFKEHEAVWYVDQQRGFWRAAQVMRICRESVAQKKRQR